MNLILKIISLITGGAHGASALGNTVTFAAVLAALAPVALYILNNRDEIFIALTLGDLAFWGAIIAAIIAVANVSKRCDSIQTYRRQLPRDAE